MGRGIMCGHENYIFHVPSPVRSAVCGVRNTVCNPYFVI